MSAGEAVVIAVPETREELVAIIEGLLDAAPTRWLPTPSRVEADRNGKTLAWFGGRGIPLAVAKTDDVLDPTVHRRAGIAQLLEAEATVRIDRAFIARMREDGDIGDGR